jgi:hypothetical protein
MKRRVNPRRFNVLCAALLFALLLPIGGPIYGQSCSAEGPFPDHFVVFDMTRDSKDANRVYSFDSSLPAGGEIQSLLLGNKAQDALTKIQESKALSSTRWLSEQGTPLNVYCVSSADPCTLRVKEERRSTRLSSDLATLRKIVATIYGQGLESGQLTVECRSYSLTEKRAYLKVSASVGGTNDTGGEAAGDKEGDADESVEAQIVTGPAEHWFLSVDVPLNDAKQAKFNSETRSLDIKDSPTEFLIAANYQVGDLFTNGSWLRGLVVKGLLTPSRNPTDQYGVGLGLRGEFLGTRGLDLSLVSPFVAWVVSREDAVESGQPRKDAKKKNQFRFGLSFNLDRALGWLGTKGSDAPAK